MFDSDDGGHCPHADIVFCPLYVAAHEGYGFGCDDGGLADGFCAINRGLDYRGELARLNAASPRLVAQLEFSEHAAAVTAQRKRNMRAAGVH